MALLAFAPGYLVPMLATLFGIYAFTRILSPSEYGNYAFVMSIMLLVQSGLLSWIDMGAKRFFERAAQTGRVPAMCVTLYLGLLICSMALLISCAVGLRLFHVPPAMAALLWLAAVAIIAKEASTVSKTLELAALSRSRYVLMECGESLIGVGFGVWLCWYKGFGADGILWGIMIGALVVVAFDAKYIKSRLRNGSFDMDMQKQVLLFSAPICISFFVEFLMSSSDRVMVQFFLGPDELGIYAVAYSIAERSVSAVFMALGIASYPLVVRAMERGGREAAIRQARQNVEVLIAIAVPAWGGFTIASGHIATVLAGPAYATRVAGLLPLAGVAVFMFSIRVHYFSHAQHLTNKTWSMLAATCPAVLINVAMNAVLLPKIGLIGAVWARLAGYLVALGINLWLCRRQLPLPFPVWGAARASVATLAMCGVLAMLRFANNTVGLIEMILVGAVFYGAVALVFDFAGLRSMLLSRRRPLPMAALRDGSQPLRNEDDMRSGQLASGRESGVALVHDVLNRITVVADASEEAGLISAIATIDKTIVISFLNQHAMNLAWHSPNFADCLIGSDILLRDGIGIELCLGMLGRPAGRNMCGTDFIPRLAKEFSGRRIALFGTKEPWTGLAAAVLRRCGCQVVAVMDGFRREADYLEEIRRTRPELVILAMGNPRQEKVASVIASSVSDPMVIVNGGAIADVLAKRFERAPLWVRRARCEWLFRLFQEPRRLWRRYLLGGLSFAWYVMRLRLAT